MKLTPSRGGFTIVETMIVLAVSGGMLLMAFLLVAGQQRKVEFSQSVNDMQQVVQEVINQAGAGFYPNIGNVKCQAAGSNLVINQVGSGAGVEQGANDGCVFLGRAIQFGNGGNRGEYVVHTVAGLQDGQDGTLAAARPEAMDVDGSYDIRQIRNGVTVVWMRYSDGVASTDISTFATLQSIGQLGSDNQLLSGSQQMAIVPVRNSGTPGTVTKNSAITAMNNQLKNADPYVNPSGGVQICLRSGGTTQSGLITVGGAGRASSVTLDIKSSVDCT